ncbi:MAG: hypothetical protein OES38_03605 [Gammaproteobacteria bacterium]|nr:hypothetical protein [Gammaproteobacteria bacterium]
MQRLLSRRGLLALLAFAWCTAGMPARAYDGEQHQQLTFLAAKQFNRCVAGTNVPMLTPLQVRYIARSNVGQAERNLFARMFNWRYYDRGAEAERSMMWAFDTRFHEHFNEVLERLNRADDAAKRYSNLGRIVSYVQVVSSPAHTVPVYTARFWRFSVTDRFDRYSVDEDAVAALIADGCDFLNEPAVDYGALVRAVATETLSAVREPIGGIPASWEVFWEFADQAGNFGEYGPAGNNFGRATQFKCRGDERCVLLKDDPLYAQFARERHLSAVRGTMGAMLLMQLGAGTTELVNAE